MQLQIKFAYELQNQKSAKVGRYLVSIKNGGYQTETMEFPWDETAEANPKHDMNRHQAFYCATAYQRGLEGGFRAARNEISMRLDASSFNAVIREIDDIAREEDANE